MTGWPRTLTISFSTSLYAIGVAVGDSPTKFTDRGKLFRSTEIGVKNSIDPCYVEEFDKKYIVWGSFNDICIVELTDDALAVKNFSPINNPQPNGSWIRHAGVTKLAGGAFEGAMIYKRGRYYYLFASVGSCCNGETSTYVGETNPGTYTYTIEGVYEENTIGVQDVEYTISKGQARIEVILPEDVEYDGEAHGATVNVIACDGDVTVTYVNVSTGEESTEAPSAVGVYRVVVEVADGQYYNGIEATSYGQFEIYAQVTGIHEINVDQKGNNEWHTIDGRRVVAPTAPGLYIHNGKKHIVK